MRRRWSPSRLRRFGLGLMLLALGYGLFAALQAYLDRAPATPEIVLLLPDGVDLRDPIVTAWQDAGRETGVVMRTELASQFVHPLRLRRRPVAIVLPDSVHRQVSPALVATLDRYARAGGNLLLTFDAGTLGPNGAYARQRSRFSRLAGVDYGLYDSLRARATVPGDIAGAPADFERFGVPPGKYVSGPGDAALSTYAYGRVRYPHFVTRGPYAGRVIFRAANDGSVLAGLHALGRGRVLFVNLPLGYLRTRSDGALLHGSLAYFNDLAGLPRLASTPRGVGGVVLNWHVDSNASYPALDAIAANTRLLSQGPFSIHITAGPDTYRLGDRTGFDVEHDPRAAAWIARFMRDGHAIGSHGGWIHNYFAQTVSDGNGATLAKYLDLNFAALQRATGHPITEYSAPNGNQPQWMTDWLDRHGVLGYYFTGDTGMAPTHTYRDGRRSDHRTWAFPITPYGRSGSFEEAMHAGVPLADIRAWLHGIVRFTAAGNTARLMYFHPPGLLLYLAPVQDMADYAASLGRDRFRWYTMTELARFLGRRERVAWSLQADSDADRLDAHGDLADMAWRLPKSRYARPQVDARGAIVLDDGDAWRVVAMPGHSLTLHLPRGAL